MVLSLILPIEFRNNLYNNNHYLKKRMLKLKIIAALTEELIDEEYVKE